jgi:hypothetical protein
MHVSIKRKIDSINRWLGEMELTVVRIFGRDGGAGSGDGSGENIC